MADHREDAFQDQIDRTSEENVTFENAIVNLTNENDSLKNEVEKLKAEISESEKTADAYSIISKALTLSRDGDKDAALTKLSEIDTSGLTQDALIIYEAAQTAITAD